MTDLNTGRVKAETVATQTEIRIYSAEANKVWVEKRRKGGGAPFNPATFNAAIQRAYVEKGITRVIGEKTVNGRRALIVESVPGSWRSDRPQSKTVAVVDAETFIVLELDYSEPNNEIAQSEGFQTEYLAAGSPKVRLSMAKHPARGW